MTPETALEITQQTIFAGLKGSPEMEILTGFCERLVAAGVPSAMRQPVAAVMPFADEAEAVELANDPWYQAWPPTSYARGIGLGRDGSRYGLDDYSEIKYYCMACLDA